MEQQNNTEKWVILGIIGCGLVAFGYMAYNKQHSARMIQDSGPIAVAAVRGSQGMDVKNISPAEVAGDYVKSLQDDVSSARSNAKKYENTAQSHENEINKVNY